MATLVLTAIVSWLLGALMHWWPLVGARARRRISVASNVAGLAFLVAGLRAEGLREAAISSMVIGGRTGYTATALASASLTYYVLTATCLLLGFVGLVFGDRLARWLAPRFLLSSVGVAWLLTVVRFLLEKSAAPSELVQVVGVTWMAPIAGAYFARCLAGEPRFWQRLASSLAGYALLVRGFVALLGVFATVNRLGTHYDVSGVTAVRVALTGAIYSFDPGSVGQLLWLTVGPQLVVWPLLTLAGGLVGAAAAALVMRGGLPGRPARPLRGPEWRYQEAGER